MPRSSSYATSSACRRTSCSKGWWNFRCARKSIFERRAGIDLPVIIQSNGLPPLLAAALLGLLKPIEQAPGIGAREGIQPLRLIFLDAIACDRTFGTKELGLLLHLGVPHVRVKFADIHENAHLRDRLKLCCAGFPHVSGESRNGQEVLRVLCRDMQCRDAPV